MQNDPETVWGKNPELEEFWSNLASEKYVVLIYKDKTHTYSKTSLNDTYDKDVIAILSSNQSQDAYEQYLYPKAKNKSVKYVIKHYTKYFKPIVSGSKVRIPL